jgi:SAM domain (Sterile alpha motif)
MSYILIAYLITTNQLLPEHSPLPSTPLPVYHHQRILITNETHKMDWYTWLSNTNLDKFLVYDYSLLFSRNELEEEDISHFDHEFLQSMGISIAKHRLEILKLSKRHRPVRLSQSALPRLFTAFHKTRQCLVRCLKALVHREYSTAIVVVERPPPKKTEMFKRSKRSETTRKVAQERPPQLIMAPPGLSLRGTSPLIFEDRFGVGLGSVESIKWDKMFQGLKPT